MTRAQTSPSERRDRGVLWVTGGTRGLGRAVALRAARDHDLAVSYRADDEAAAATRAAVVERSGCEPLLLRGNLAREGVAEEQMRRILEVHDRLHAVVHCAALATFKAITALRPRELRRTFEHSFEALHRVVLVASEPIASTRGSIVAVSSAGARRAIPWYGALGAAKGAMEAYARHLAAELGPAGVNVNVVSPGLLPKDDSSRLLVDPAALAEVETRTPLRRLVTLEEVADTILFLVSGAATGVTGQVITVDGGHDVVA